MSLLPQFIITQPGLSPTFYDWKAMMNLAKLAVNSDKYKAWLKRSHLLGVWDEPVDDKTFKSTKWQYVQLYLEGQGYLFEEI